MRTGAHERTTPLAYLGNIKQFQFNTHKYRKKEKNTNTQPKSIIMYACVERDKYENCGRKEWINFRETNTLDLECRSFYRFAQLMMICSMLISARPFRPFWSESNFVPFCCCFRLLLQLCLSTKFRSLKFIYGLNVVGIGRHFTDQM